MPLAMVLEAGALLVYLQPHYAALALDGNRWQPASSSSSGLSPRCQAIAMSLRYREKRYDSSADVMISGRTRRFINTITEDYPTRIAVALLSSGYRSRLP